MFKKYLFYSVFSGVLLGFSWPHYFWEGFIFIALVPLFFLVEGIIASKTKSKYFLFLFFSFLTFLIWNVITTYWLYIASITGAVAAILINTFYYTFFFSIYYFFRRKTSNLVSYLFLIALWVCFEHFHFNWDLTWPWLTFGHVFSEQTAWVQWYEYTGVFGGSIWVLISNILTFEFFKKYKKTSKKKNLKRGSLIALIIFIPIGVSQIMLLTHKTNEKKIEAIVVQPNINPYSEKFYLRNEQLLDTLTSMAEDTISEETAYIVAPETYFSQGLGLELSKLKHYPLYKKINSFAKKHPNVNFVSGIQFYNTYFQEERPSPSSNKINNYGWIENFNSMIQIKHKDSAQIYHKSKLVAGVETFPFRSTLEKLLGNVMIDMGGVSFPLTIQDSVSIFVDAQKQIMAAPIICYEAVYGEHVRDYVLKGAQFLMIISNDAWWGNSPAHKQLLSLSRLRAIETRRSIVRSANTGISAFIDETGAVYNSLKYDSKGILIDKVALSNKETFYTKNGNYIIKIAIIVIFTCFLILLKNTFIKSKKN